MFKALLLEKNEDGVTSRIAEIEDSALPDGDVLIDVSHSTLNYKDGLVLNGLGGLVRDYPHVPGVDLAGQVAESSHPDYEAGDAVVSTGWHVGERHWGGYAEKARLRGDWLVKLPDGLSARQAMAIGTAGFTSMLAVMALEDHGATPDGGPILVTGGAGGVGSVAIAILAKLGYEVTASTGRASSHDYLKALGASEIIERSLLSDGPGRPLDKATWAGCIDAVGSTTLATAISQMKHGGAIAAVGLAGGNDLNTTVIPFLLRGVKLLGIDSVLCPKPRREAAWQRLASDLPLDKLEAMISTASLEELPGLGSDILKGQVKGRVVVELS